jgi:hypothetical protein
VSLFMFLKANSGIGNVSHSLTIEWKENTFNLKCACNFPSESNVWKLC